MDDYKVVWREKGVLPITLGVRKRSIFKSHNTIESVPVSKVGIRGGFYHAVTGYSFPNALNVARLIAEEVNEQWPDESPMFPAFMVGVQEGHWIKERFLRLLNRMLFRATKPEERYSVLQRFYGLNQGLIKRFYAGELTWRDKARILIGKPPRTYTQSPL